MAVLVLGYTLGGTMLEMPAFAMGSLPDCPATAYGLHRNDYRLANPSHDRFPIVRPIEGKRLCGSAL